MRFSAGISTPNNLGMFCKSLKLLTCKSVKSFPLSTNHLSLVTNHLCLSLPLFMTCIRANDANDSFAANNFAIFAKLFNRRANFHIKSFLSQPKYALAINRKAITAALLFVQAAREKLTALCLWQSPITDARLTGPPDTCRSATLLRWCLQLWRHPLGPCQNFWFGLRYEHRMLKMGW